MSKAKTRKALTKAAQTFFNQEIGPFSAGLCGAGVYYMRGCNWQDKCELFATIQKYMKPNQSWLAKPGTKWDQRAMFALLVAEAEK